MVRYPVNGENSDDKTCLVFGTWILNNNFDKYRYLLNNYNNIISKCNDFSAKWRTLSRINVSLNYFYFSLTNLLTENFFLNQSGFDSKDVKSLCRNISMTFFISYIFLSVIYFFILYYIYVKLNTTESKNFIIYSLLTLIIFPLIIQNSFFLKPFYYSPSKIVVISIICLHASIIDYNKKLTIFSIISLVGLNIIQSQFILLIFTVLTFLFYPHKTNLKKIFITAFFTTLIINIALGHKFQIIDFDLLNYFLNLIVYYKYSIIMFIIVLCLVYKNQRFRTIIFTPTAFLLIFFLILNFISIFTEYFISEFNVNSLLLSHLTKLSGRIVSILYFIPIVLSIIHINIRFPTLFPKLYNKNKIITFIIILSIVSLNTNSSNFYKIKNTFSKFEQIDSDIYSGLLNEYNRKGLSDPKTRLETLDKNIGQFLYFDPNFETELHINFYSFFKNNDL